MQILTVIDFAAKIIELDYLFAKEFRSNFALQVSCRGDPCRTQLGFVGKSAKDKKP